MLSTLLNTPCTITRRTSSTSEDAYGDTIPGTTTTTTVCELQQRQRSEQPGAEVSDTIWLLILPAGTGIDTGDKVTVDGVDYEMVGDPWPARNPRTGQASHVEATLRRTAGDWDGDPE
jgi:hypothetical protein